MSTTDTTKQNAQSVATTFTHDPSPLEMDAETFYHLGMVAVEIATEYLEGIPEKPVYRPMTPSERQMLLYQQLPEYGRSPEALFDFFEEHILPHAMGNQHPRFAAWVNPAGAPIGMLADFLAAVMNPSAAGGDHAAIYVEHCVVRWLMELIDFPVEGSAGILVGGGSVASLYCLAVARQWAAAEAGWNMRTEGLQGTIHRSCSTSRKRGIAASGKHRTCWDLESHVSSRSMAIQNGPACLARSGYG